jgi:hypothetical protein
MNSEFDFGDYIPGDDMPMCDMTDHGLSLLTIGIQLSNKKPGQMPALRSESPCPSLPLSISAAQGPGDIYCDSSHLLAKSDWVLDMPGLRD